MMLMSPIKAIRRHNKSKFQSSWNGREVKRPEIRSFKKKGEYSPKIMQKESTNPQSM